MTGKPISHAGGLAVGDTLNRSRGKTNGMSMSGKSTAACHTQGPLGEGALRSLAPNIVRALYGTSPCSCEEIVAGPRSNFDRRFRYF